MKNKKEVTITIDNSCHIDMKFDGEITYLDLLAIGKHLISFAEMRIEK